MIYSITFLNVAADKISTHEFDDLHEFASHYSYLECDSNFQIIKVTDNNTQ